MKKLGSSIKTRLENHLEIICYPATNYNSEGLELLTPNPSS